MLAAILPVIVTILIGFLIQRMRFVSDQGINDIKWIVVHVLLPVSLFSAFSKASFSLRELVLILIMAALTLAAFYAGRILCARLGIENKYAPIMCYSVEGGMLGYALFTMLFGSENLYHIAFLDLGNAFVLFALIAIMNIGGAPGEKQNVVMKFVTPVNIGIVLGIIFSVTGVNALIEGSAFGDAYNSTLSFIGGATSVMILIALGYGLKVKIEALGDVVRTLGARVAIYIVVGIIIVVSAILLFPDDPMYKFAALIIAAMPPSFSFSTVIKDSDDFVESFTAVYAVLSIIIFIIISAFALR